MERPIQVPEISSTTRPLEIPSSISGRIEIRDQPVQDSAVSSTTTLESRETFAALERLVGRWYYSDDDD